MKSARKRTAFRMLNATPPSTASRCRRHSCCWVTAEDGNSEQGFQVSAFCRDSRRQMQWPCPRLATKQSEQNTPVPSLPGRAQVPPTPAPHPVAPVLPQRPPHPGRDLSAFSARSGLVSTWVGARLGRPGAVGVKNKNKSKTTVYEPPPQRNPGRWQSWHASRMLTEAATGPAKLSKGPAAARKPIAEAAATGSKKKSGRFRIGTALKAQFIRSPEGAEPHNTLLRDTGTCRKT